ncbi:MAG TPA: hydroxyacid dehydrogenase [Caldilineaceae bacterium]|nr:hydroxyacid dehydrogenase [Caldilineaceae bacterium]
MKALFLLNSDAYHKIYSPAQQATIANLVDLYAPPQTAQSVAANPAILHEAEIIFSGWGMPRMDETFLAHCPNLKIVFYGAGSIKHCTTEAFWTRNIPITSSYAANAVPVAEFALAQILLCLKRTWQHALAIKASGAYPGRLPVPGGYGSTVGIIALGMIGRMVCEHLRRFDLNVIAYDPYVTAEDAANLGVTLVALDEIFAQADVVSLHAPWIDATVGLITGAHLATMKAGATFINTARGAIVCEAEMIDVLQARPDLLAVLDVTYPEPPVAGSPLYSLPNVILTPHIAGSLDTECQRMGQIVVDELQRYLAGEPLQWAISQEQASIMA